MQLAYYFFIKSEFSMIYMFLLQVGSHIECEKQQISPRQPNDPLFKEQWHLGVCISFKLFNSKRHKKDVSFFINNL